MASESSERGREEGPAGAKPEGASSVSSRDQAYLGMLVAAGLWALFSAVTFARVVRLGERGLAWGWAASFAFSALAAAYCFGRLL